MKKVNNINADLVGALNVFIESETETIYDVIKMTSGNRPVDDGHLIVKAEEYEKFIKQENSSKKYIIGKYKECLWLIDADPHNLRKMLLDIDRIKIAR